MEFRFARKAIDKARWPIAWPFAVSPQIQHNKTRTNSFSDPIQNIGLNLKVMSFNIRRGTARDGKNHWRYRRDLVHEILNQYLPDVLCLQEALDFQISEIRGMLPGYENIGIGDLGGTKRLHNAIFYNATRFAISEGDTFWLSDTPDIPRSKGWGNIMPRICTWARLIEKESQQAFYVYNTHLDHISQRSRKKSVIFLIKHIHARSFPNPFILTGDFNARETSAPIQYLKGKKPLRSKTKVIAINPIPLVDTFRVRYPKNRKTATFHGFGKYFFRFRLDYIFAPSSVRILDAKIIQQRWKKCYPSDHFPLFTHIDLPIDLVPAKPRSFFEKAANY